MGLPAFYSRRAVASWLRGESGVTRIAFGSCLVQSEPQPVWDAIRRCEPDFMLLLGDNVYADTTDLAHMRAQYALLGANPGFRRLRARVPLLATWDDHDYGENDAGGDFPLKRESKRIMLDFFDEPARSARRAREGIYESYYFGEAPRRLQVILLDLRSFRSRLNHDGTGYVPWPDGSGELLGEEQWRWLERELARPADLRILGSSIQLVSGEHPWEKWANFPREKERLLALLDRYGVRNLLTVSGDMHIAELSAERTPGGIPLYDFTSSGLNRRERFENLPNSRRLAYLDDAENFGLLRVQWLSREVRVRLECRRATGALAFRRSAVFPRG